MKQDASKSERVLILDHNIMRFHHYDLMESLISHPPICELLKEECQPYLKMDKVDKLRFLKNENSHYNILDFFEGDFGTEEYVAMFSSMVNYAEVHTPLNMYFGLDSLTRTSNLEVTIFKLPGDIEYEDSIIGPNCKVYTRDDIFDSVAMSQYIMENNVSLLICDSLDMIIAIGCAVTTPLMFTIPKYGFNVELIGEEHRVFRRIADLVALGKMGHSIGAFDPLVYL